jgi:hypothetical protein
MAPVRLDRAALVERAKILLLAAEGLSNTEIAGQVGCSRPTVILWRHRYTTAGLDGLLDKHRPGRPQTVRADRRAEILAATLTPPPEHLGITQHAAHQAQGQLVVHGYLAASQAGSQAPLFRPPPAAPRSPWSAARSCVRPA